MRFVGGAAASALAFLTLVVIVATGRPHFDLQIATWVAAHRSPLGR
jgi:hypothetical protein